MVAIPRLVEEAFKTKRSEQRRLSMNPEMTRLCEAVERVAPMVGQHTVMGRTEEIVRAVLNELREPSEGMRTAGQAGQRAFEAMPGADSEYLSSEPYTFAAMIDAILDLA